MIGLSEFAGLAVLEDDGYWRVTKLGREVARLFTARGPIPDGVDPDLDRIWMFDREWVQRDLAAGPAALDDRVSRRP